MPAGRQRPGFGLAVADHDGGDQVRIVEDGAVGVGEGIAELSPLADGAGGLGGGVARDAARVGELPEEFGHALPVVADIAVDLGVGALKPGVRHYRRTAVAGPGNKQHALAVPADDPVEVGVDEVQSRRCAPVAQQPGLGVAGAQRFAQQRVGPEIDLPHGQVVGGPPPAVHELQVRPAPGLPPGTFRPRFGRAARGAGGERIGVGGQVAGQLAGQWIPRFTGALGRYATSIATRPRTGHKPAGTCPGAALASPLPPGSVDPECSR